MLSCGKQGALAVLQQGPVCQQWEQHRSQPAAEGDRGLEGAAAALGAGESLLSSLALEN